MWLKTVHGLEQGKRLSALPRAPTLWSTLAKWGHWNTKWGCDALPVFRLFFSRMISSHSLPCLPATHFPIFMTSPVSIRRSSEVLRTLLPPPDFPAWEGKATHSLLCLRQTSLPASDHFCLLWTIHQHRKPHSSDTAIKKQSGGCGDTAPLVKNLLRSEFHSQTHVKKQTNKAFNPSPRKAETCRFLKLVVGFQGSTIAQKLT